MAHPRFSTLQKAAAIGICLLTVTGCKEDPEAHQPPAPRTLAVVLGDLAINLIFRTVISSALTIIIVPVLYYRSVASVILPPRR